MFEGSVALVLPSDDEVEEPGEALTLLGERLDARAHERRLVSGVVASLRGGGEERIYARWLCRQLTEIEASVDRRDEVPDTSQLALGVDLPTDAPESGLMMTRTPSSAQ